MSYITIDLHSYQKDKNNRIEIDLDDFENEIDSHIQNRYGINLSDPLDYVIDEAKDKFNIDITRLLKQDKGTLFMFICKNLADENKLNEIIEKYNLQNLSR
jgi:hypothetical protein